MPSSPTCWRSSRWLALPFASGLAALPVAAAAQMGNPGFMAPDTRTDESGMPAADQKNAADILFVQLLGEGGLAEVEFGELAVEKAGAPAVKAFAERMVADHGAANTKLAAIAEDAEIAVPAELNAEHAAMRETSRQWTPPSSICTTCAPRWSSTRRRRSSWNGRSTRDRTPRCKASPPRPCQPSLSISAMARGIVEDLSREQVAAVPPAPRASP